MMLYPSIVDLLEKSGSKYSLVIAAAMRAREICVKREEEGEPIDGARGITKAAEQIANGSVTVINYEGKDGIIEKVMHNNEIAALSAAASDEDEEDVEADEQE